MNKEKFEEMAEDISTKVLSKYSEIEQANMPYIICKEVSIKSIQAALSLPEVKAMKDALESCEVNGTGFTNMRVRKVLDDLKEAGLMGGK